MKRILLLAVILILSSNLLTSCYTYYTVSRQSEYNKTYVGKTHNEIVNRLGAPDRQTSDGAGGLILIYESFSSQSIATAHNVNYFTGTYTPGTTTTTHTDYTHFYINNQNKCYNVKTNHRRGVSEFSPTKTVLLGATILAPIIILCAAAASE